MFVKNVMFPKSETLLPLSLESTKESVVVVLVVMLLLLLLRKLALDVLATAL